MRQHALPVRSLVNGGLCTIPGAKILLVDINFSVPIHKDPFFQLDKRTALHQAISSLDNVKRTSHSANDFSVLKELTPNHKSSANKTK